MGEAYNGEWRGCSECNSEDPAGRLTDSRVGLEIDGQYAVPSFGMVISTRVVML